MTIGAVLGIVAGIAVALFVVPPLMDHFFGEPTVKVGGVYRGDGREVGVLRTGTTAAGGFEVLFDVTSNKTWQLDPGEFEIELTSGPRLKALPPDAGDPRTSLDFPLGARRELLLRFPAADRRDARPVALYFKDPRVRFELGAAK